MSHVHFPNKHLERFMLKEKNPSQINPVGLAVLWGGKADEVAL